MGHATRVAGEYRYLLAHRAAGGGGGGGGGGGEFACLTAAACDTAPDAADTHIGSEYDPTITVWHVVRALLDPLLPALAPRCACLLPGEAAAAIVTQVDGGATPTDGSAAAAIADGLAACAAAWEGAAEVRGGTTTAPPKLPPFTVTLPPVPHHHHDDPHATPARYPHHTHARLGEDGSAGAAVVATLHSTPADDASSDDSSSDEAADGVPAVVKVRATLAGGAPAAAAAAHTRRLTSGAQLYVVDLDALLTAVMQRSDGAPANMWAVHAALQRALSHVLAHLHLGSTASPGAAPAWLSESQLLRAVFGGGGGGGIELAYHTPAPLPAHMADAHCDAETAAVLRPLTGIPADSSSSSSSSGGGGSGSAAALQRLRDSHERNCVAADQLCLLLHAAAGRPHDGGRHEPARRHATMFVASSGSGVPLAGAAAAALHCALAPALAARRAADGHSCVAHPVASPHAPLCGACIPLPRGYWAAAAAAAAGVVPDVLTPAWCPALFPHRTGAMLTVMYHGTYAAVAPTLESEGFHRPACRRQELCRASHGVKCHCNMLALGVYFGAPGKARKFASQRGVYDAAVGGSVGACLAAAVDVGALRTATVAPPCPCGCGRSYVDHTGRYHDMEGCDTFYCRINSLPATRKPEWAVADPARIAVVRVVLVVMRAES